MKTLILIRGLPGSGKSTYAQGIASSYFLDGGRTVAVCSTDDYHMVDGEYVFQPSRLGEFHNANQLQAGSYMAHGIELVIVDNTNIKRREMKPYIDYAKGFEYDIKEVIVGEERLLPELGDACPYKFADYIDMCAKRNTHGVPRDVIEKMARKFEK